MTGTAYATPVSAEHRETFPCFGSDCTVIVGDGRDGPAASGVSLAKRRLLEWHSQFSRFQPDSELSRLNADLRETVPVTPMLRRVVEVGIRAAQATGGLVDPTLGVEIEQAGYAADLAVDSVPLEVGLALAPPRAPAGAGACAAWRRVIADRAGRDNHPAPRDQARPGRDRQGCVRR